MTKPVLFFILLLFDVNKIVSGSCNQSGASQWRCDYDFYEECGGWVKFHDAPAPWSEARLRCYYEGAQLATPTPELINTLKNIVKTNYIPSGKIFTGISAVSAYIPFTSVEGIPLSRIPHEWAGGEPNYNTTAENCIALNEHGTLAVVNCNSLLPFICYKKNEALKLNVCGTFDNEYTLDGRTGSCYKFHRDPHIWFRANMICQSEGSYLAIINSDTEAQIIKEIFARNPENSLPPSPYKDWAALGYRDIDEHGTWVTVQGQSIKNAGYDKFAPGQPDNYESLQYCGGILRSGLLDDIHCDKKVSFICEKDPNSLLCNN